MLKDLADIGSVIPNAIVFDPRNWRGTSMDADSLPHAVQTLFALLEERQVEYVLVGGIALLNYVEGRNTEDIDLIMARSALTHLPEIEVVSQEMYFAHGTFQGLQIVILLTENPLFQVVQHRYTTRQTFLEQSIPMATVDGVLLLKLYALPSLYRQGGFARVSMYENDIAALMYTYQPNTKALFAELTAHLSNSNLNSLREIVAELEQRIRRFREGRGNPASGSG